MSGPEVERWTSRQADEPQCVVAADVEVPVLLEAVAAGARSAGLAARSVPGGLDASRGIRGGYLLSEVVQLPLMAVLAKVEIQVRVLVAEPGRARVSVTCVAGARELGAAKRVARALTDARSRMEAAGTPLRISPWAALWQRGTGGPEGPEVV
ncbi:hypothetical protein [Cellulomonas gilvus]|uniref:Uncharacterized protein n=1 Tax=Cellulomonas gilvus (strain ATCC 13127 / NRRL B-14078) TaxID=593907 RepID=F8A1T7_CELGA|nr:hypothetical protein [Cellulomonas gilvus]AEI11744.1 hypothetical protein Celgi_1225 [Cellulomonas gilvus ATCC 13127]